jgi:hypothetical protein
MMKMASDETICVMSERPVVQRQRYELSVYLTGSDYYSSWLCHLCPTRGETPCVAEQAIAHQDGHDALEAHHQDRHAAG